MFCCTINMKKANHRHLRAVSYEQLVPWSLAEYPIYSICILGFWLIKGETTFFLPAGGALHYLYTIHGITIYS